MVVFYVKINENTYLKGRAIMQMYRVVPQKKIGKYTIICITNDKRIQIKKQLLMNWRILSLD